MDVFITVRNRCALPAPHPQLLVCGNNGYRVHFTFDAEWDCYPLKTVRMTVRRGGETVSQDIPMHGGCCLLPAVRGADQAELGVFAGDICTTTPARFPCLPCITDLPAEKYRPEPDVLRLMLARLAGKPAEPPCSGLYLVTKDADYIVTDAGAYLMTKE